MMAMAGRPNPERRGGGGARAPAGRRPVSGLGVLLLWVALGGALRPLHAQQDTLLLLGDFPPGWRQAWRERVFGDRRNTFELAVEGHELVLQVTSERAAAGMWRPLTLDPARVATVSWRWKVAAPIPDNSRERSRAGDDYAARLFVTFEGEPFSRRSRALCYVWAATEAAGSVFRSPYARNVAMVVLQRGGRQAGRWVREERNVVADYWAAFGEAPSRVTGVALMVDTDDTQSRAVAWFDGISLVLTERAPDASPRR